MKKAKKILALVLVLAMAVCAFSACDEDVISEDVTGETSVASYVQKAAEGYLEASKSFDYESILEYVAEGSEQYAAIQETIAAEQDTADGFEAVYGEGSYKEFTKAMNKVIVYEITDVTVADDETTATATFTLSSPDFTNVPIEEFTTWDEFVEAMGTVESEGTLELELTNDQWKVVKIS